MQNNSLKQNRLNAINNLFSRIKYKIDYKDKDNSINRETGKYSIKLLRDYSEKILHINVPTINKNNFTSYSSKTSSIMSHNDPTGVKLPNVFSLTSVFKVNKNYQKPATPDRTSIKCRIIKNRSSKSFQNGFQNSSFNKNNKVGTKKKDFPKIVDIYTSLRNDNGLNTFSKPNKSKNNGYFNQRHNSDKNLKRFPKFEVIRLPENLAKTRVDPKYKTSKDIKDLKAKLKLVCIIYNEV